MRMEYGFTVPVPVARAWAVLLDVERVAPCLPGAALTGFDGETFEGTVKVRVGPVSLTYQGKGRFVERDESAGLVVMQASGRDSRGGGTASTAVTAHLQPGDDPGSTRVTTVVDLTVTGRPAQFGRGMITEVGGRLVGQFAECLAQRLAQAPAPVPVEAAAAAAPAVDAVPVTMPGPVPQAPPVDLPAAGGGPLLRRIVPYVVGFVLGALVIGAVLMIFDLP